MLTDGGCTAAVPPVDVQRPTPPRARTRSRLAASSSSSLPLGRPHPQHRTAIAPFPCSSCSVPASPARRSSSPQFPSSHLFASLAASRHRYALVKLQGCLGAALSRRCHRFSVHRQCSAVPLTVAMPPQAFSQQAVVTRGCT